MPPTYRAEEENRRRRPPDYVTIFAIILTLLCSLVGVWYVILAALELAR